MDSSLIKKKMKHIYLYRILTFLIPIIFFSGCCLQKGLWVKYHNEELIVELENSLKVPIEVYVSSYPNWRDKTAAFKDENGKPFSILPKDSTYKVASFYGGNRLILKAKKDSAQKYDHNMIRLEIDQYSVIRQYEFKVDEEYYAVYALVMGVFHDEDSKGDENHVFGHICDPRQGPCGD